MTMPTHDTGDVGRLYDETADRYASTLGDTLHFGYWDQDPAPGDLVASFPDAKDRLTDLAIGRLGVGAGDRVLDVGCGVGGPALRLARASGARVVGVTVSGVQVERAEELAEAEGLGGRVGFQKADAMALPFPDGSFDAAWALESIVHMPDRAGALREAARVLRPGGRLVLTDFVERAPLHGTHRRLVDEYLRALMIGSPVSLTDYPRVLAAAGLHAPEVTDISRHTVRPTFLVWAEMFETAGFFDAAAMAGVPELGYVLATARKPETAHSKETR